MKHEKRRDFIGKIHRESSFGIHKQKMVLRNYVMFYEWHRREVKHQKSQKVN